MSVRETIEGESHQTVSLWHNCIVRCCTCIRITTTSQLGAGILTMAALVVATAVAVVAIVVLVVVAPLRLHTILPSSLLGPHIPFLLLLRIPTDHPHHTLHLAPHTLGTRYRYSERSLRCGLFVLPLRLFRFDIPLGLLLLIACHISLCTSHQPLLCSTSPSLSLSQPLRR